MRIPSLIQYQHLFGFSKGLMFADEWHWRNGVRSNGPLHPSGIESALVIVSISRKGRYQLPPPFWPSLRSTQHLATVETFSCLGPLRPSGRSASYHWISQLSDSPSITVRSWMIVKETDFCFSSISLEFLPLVYIRFLLSSFSFFHLFAFFFVGKVINGRQTLMAFQQRKEMETIIRQKQSLFICN